MDGGPSYVNRWREKAKYFYYGRVRLAQFLVQFSLL
jgi:hypothetical protein